MTSASTQDGGTNVVTRKPKRSHVAIKPRTRESTGPLVAQSRRELGTT